jgi:hypothetical protein
MPNARLENGEMRDKVGKNGKPSPLDFLRRSTQYVDDGTKEWRFAVCESCPHFLELTKQCKKCGCFMHLKTKLAEAECPIGKWKAVQKDN